MAVSMSCHRLAILAVVVVALTASSKARAADTRGALFLEQMFGVPSVERMVDSMVTAYREPAEEDSISGDGSDANAATESTPVTAATGLEAGADGVEESAGESTPKGAAELETGDVHPAEERMDVDADIEGEDGQKGGKGRDKKQTGLSDRFNGDTEGREPNKPKTYGSWSARKKFAKLLKRKRHGAETDGLGEDGNEEGGVDVSEKEAKPSEPTDKHGAKGPESRKYLRTKGEGKKSEEDKVVEAEGGGEDGSKQGSGDVFEEAAKPSEHTDKHGAKGDTNRFISLAREAGRKIGNSAKREYGKLLGRPDQVPQDVWLAILSPSEGVEQKVQEKTPEVN